MIRIENQVIDAVKMKWNSITFPLKAGTPISIGGTVANNEKAIGIVMQNVNVKPETTELLYILIGGDVLLDEVEKSAGITLTKEAKASMSAIRFHMKDGKVDDSADEKATFRDVTSEEIEEIVDALE